MRGTWGWTAAVVLLVGGCSSSPAPTGPCSRSSSAAAAPPSYPMAAAIGPDRRIVIITADTPPLAFAYDVEQNAWSSVPSIPTTRSVYGQIAMASTASALYAMYTDGTAGPTLQAYASGSWKARAKPPAAFTNFTPAQIVVFGTTLYVLAGNASGAFASYEESTDAWAMLPAPNLMALQSLIAVGVPDGRIFAVGNINSQVFDTKAMAWSSILQEPDTRLTTAVAYDPATAAIYTFGHPWSKGSVPPTAQETEAMTVATQAWAFGPQVPMLLGNFDVALSACDGQIYVVGGYDGANNMSNHLLRFDPVAQRWD